MSSAVDTSRIDAIRREAQRSLFRARNGIKVLRGGGHSTTGVTPKTVVWRRGKAQLLRCVSENRTRRPPLVIVWSIISKAYILDLKRGQSFIEQMLDAGYDVFLLDWGEPDAVDAGNDLELYVDNYLPRALERAMEVAESDEVDILGYCFGGVLTTLALAGHPEIPVRNLVLMATPADMRTQEGIMTALARRQLEVDDLIDETGNVSAAVLMRGFATLRPTADISKYAMLWEHLWNDEFVDSYQAMAGWVGDQVALPGAVARQIVDILLRENQLLSGRVHVGGRVVDLADITCPLLNVMAEHDYVVPPRASQPLTALTGGTDVSELRIPAGHIGLAAGREASRITVPRIIEWLNERSN